jgi:molybdopterin molybdotransferase
MPEFLRLITPEEALQRWLKALPPIEPRVEEIATASALGRVLAQDLSAPEPLPPFPRSTVDGYAVHAADTFGASASLPAYLRLVGEVPMGAAASIHIQPGQAAIVHTGGMIPQGADAVVMIEDTQQMGTAEIEVLKPVAVGQNILAQGEDVQPGQVVLKAGSLLRPQEIGGLMALGLTTIAVVSKPRVGLISTGDEVIPPAEKPRPGQVRDVNSHALAALVQRGGGEPLLYGIIPDDPQSLYEAARRAQGECDLVVITAGSSVSARDMTAQVVERLGKPGVLVHGIAIRPGKPTILAIADELPVLGLPGNPVSALVVGRLFILPILQRLLGLRRPILHPGVSATLSTNLASETGREDYVPVRLVQGDHGWQAEPVFGRSNLIFTLVRADGWIRIPPEATGLGDGEQVWVTLF